MKKLALLCMLLIASLCFAQKFEVTATGLKAVNEDPTKNYIVLDIPGKTAKELYETAFKYTTAKDADSQLKKYLSDITPDEQVSFKCTEKSMLHFKAGFGTVLVYDGEFTVQLNFKDGRARMEIQDFTLTSSNKDLPEAKFPFHALYNKKGELKKVEEKKELDGFFSNFVINLTYVLKEGKAGVEVKEGW